MAYQYQKGFTFQGTTFVTDKSDIKNAKDEDFVEGSALLPLDEDKIILSKLH